MSEGQAPALQPLRIRLPFRSEAEFAERYHPHVTRGGIFVASRLVKPVGTPLRFEFVLADGTRLLRGEGTVLRVLQDPSGAPSGMTLRFTRLDAASKTLLDRMITAAHARTTGEAALLEAPAAPGPLSDGDASARPSAGGGPLLATPGAEDVPVGQRASAGASPSSVPAPSGAAQATSSDGQDLFAARRAFIPRRRTLDLDLSTIVVKDKVDELALGVWWNGRGWRAATALESAPHPTPLFPTGEHALAATPAVDAPDDVRFAALVESVRAEHGRLPSRTVMAVPPAWGLAERLRLRDAARAVGFEQLALAHPTSLVALAHANGRGFTRKRLLICELSSQGCALVELQGNDVQVTAHAQANAAEGLESGSPAWLEAWRTAVTSLLRDPWRGASLLDGGVLCGSLDDVGPLGAALPGWVGGTLSLSETEPAAVELGAALLAQEQGRAVQGKRAAQLEDVLLRPVLLAQPGEPPARVLEAGHRLPTERALPFRLEAGTPLPLAFFEGDREGYLGLLVLECAQSGVATLCLRAQADGLITLSAVLPSGRRVEPELRPGPLPEAFSQRPVPPPPPTPERRGMFSAFQRLLRRK